MEPLYWLIAIAVCLVIEIITLGLTTIWFVPGAMVSFFLSLAGASWQIQFGVCFVLSLLMFYFVRPSAVAKFNIKREKTNIDAIVGMEGKVTEDIDNMNETGAVKVDGKEWTARSKDGTMIKAGTIITVLEITGVKLIVKIKEED